jgi:hypothetical protein
MNLYQYYNKPDTLLGGTLPIHLVMPAEAAKIILYKHNHPDYDKCFHTIAKDPMRSYLLLRSMFDMDDPISPTNKYTLEVAIATNAEASFKYARNVLEGPFELGEKTILASEYHDRYLELRNNP